MLKDKLSILIQSCDKFSDLWDTHIYLLNKNWADRQIDTFLVTDKSTEKQYPNVQVISAGKETEFSQRISYAISQIKTEYILLTLDDYFPIYNVNSEKIEELIEYMEKYGLEYVRLFKRPNSNKKIEGTKNLYKIDLNSKNDTNYQVNLYVGIWRKDFLEKTIGEIKNAWEYELSLSKIARELNANCAMSKGKEFEILDVVRKGQLLHKANKYLKKNKLYDGPRTVISWKTEFRINLFTFIKDHMPQSVINWGKGILRKRGYHFFSDNI